MFASDLEKYEIMDLEAATKAIAQRPRAEGETAFPEIATIIAEVKLAARDRRIAAERERKMADEAAELRRRRTHPEDFIADKEIAEMEARLREKYQARFGVERENFLPEPKMLCCPECSAELPVPQNIRFWEPSGLREHADRIEELRRIADKNREANRAEVTA